MSDPKYALRELLPSLSLSAQGIIDPEVKARFKFLGIPTFLWDAERRAI